MPNTNQLTRREILKLGSMSAFMHLIPSSTPQGLNEGTGGSHKNILMIVFDTFSAEHIHLFGYDRQTTPNIAKLLDKSIVYHHHYAGGPFTSPGTASLLTGTYPWTHRALRFGKTLAEFVDKNIFSLFEDHYRFAYTQNPVADILLRQFTSNIENHISLESLYIANNWVSTVFNHDYDAATLSERQIIKPGNEIPYSIFLSKIFKRVNNSVYESIKERYEDSFPRGLPTPGVLLDRPFTIEKPLDWLISNIPNMEEPFLGYFHLLPPHEPYKTRIDFFNTFKDDGYFPLEKPEHYFSMGKTYDNLIEKRRHYDEFILYVDHEFGRLFDQLKDLNILDNTILVLTSDHGQLFERGVLGHTSPALFLPVTHIPLMIFDPAQEMRTDITINTSAIDVLPTLLHLSNLAIPDWCEGEILPPYSSKQPVADRKIYTVHSLHNERGKPMVEGSISQIRGDLKLSHYFGYEKKGQTEPFTDLYDLHDDRQEMNDLFDAGSAPGSQMLDELLQDLNKAEEPFK